MKLKGNFQAIMRRLKQDKKSGDDDDGAMILSQQDVRMI